MGYYQSKSTTTLKRDCDRDTRLAKMGFKILKDYPEYQTALTLARKLLELCGQIHQQGNPDPKFLAWEDQTYRAGGLSIIANLSEGHGRGTVAQTLQFYRIAKGSAFEALSLLLVAPVPIPDELTALANACIKQLDETILKLATERLGNLDAD